jgi:Tfp pilus assembly protein PilO
MTAQMQKVLLGLGVVVVAALLWVALVAPAREDRTAAKDAQAQAESQAAAVAGQLATAREAATRTPQNAATLRRLAVAVPEKVEAPALIDGLDSTAKRYGVAFDVLKVTDGAATAATVAPAPGATTGTTTGTAGATTTTTTTTAPSGAAADGSAAPAAPATPTAPAGSVPVQLSIEISGRYTGVTKFLKSVQSDVRVRDDGRVSAKGRLLRVESVDLASSGTGGGRTLKGTLSVVAYLLPKDTGTAATAASTATAPATTGSQP